MTRAAPPPSAVPGAADRRGFLRATAVLGGALLLEGCPPSTEPFAPAPPPPPVPTQGLAVGLPRDAVLALADATAATHMQSYHHCAQASCRTLQELFGLPDGGLLRALTPLPGIAERGETCGAVLGPLLALGLVFGRDHPEDDAGWRASLIPTRAFCEQFVQAQGSTQCRELLHRRFGRVFELATPAGRAEYVAVGGPAACLGLVQAAVRLAALTILDTPPGAAGDVIR